MSSPESRTCAVCGDVAATTSEHSIHVTLEHPELSRSHRREHGTTATRPVSCWRCGKLLERGARMCECGWEHPGFSDPVASRIAHARYDDPETDALFDLDHRGRPR